MKIIEWLTYHTLIKPIHNLLVDDYEQPKQVEEDDDEDYEGHWLFDRTHKQ